jgi:hypothetical protein
MTMNHLDRIEADAQKAVNVCQATYGPCKKCDNDKCGSYNILTLVKALRVAMEWANCKMRDHCNGCPIENLIKPHCSGYYVNQHINAILEGRE